MQLLPGARLGVYEVAGPLGSGGMGEVYLARDTRLERRVALKILPVVARDDDSRRRRFLQEARAAAQLTHPNIAVVYDVGEHEGISYIVMEYIEGRTLAEQLRDQAMATGEILGIATQVAEALDAAHASGSCTATSSRRMSC